MKNDGTPMRETLSEAAPILKTYLGAAEVEDLRAFIEARLDDGKPTAMVYGIYNSGKSTLLNALCGRERARVTSRPETDRVTPYVWEGTEILDTPGIDAPHEHERVSREALDRTDVILFVMDSSSTFEEDAVYNEIIGILDRNKSLMIVVNNKGGLSRADEGYIRICDKIQENLAAAAARQGLPPDRASPPIRMVDARTGLKGRLANKPELVYASGLADLEADLKRMLGAAGFHDVVNTVGQRMLDDLDRALVKASPSAAADGSARRIADGEAGLRGEKGRVESALSQERLRAVARFRRRALAVFDSQQPKELLGACVEFSEAVRSAIARELAAAHKRFPELAPPPMDSSDAMEAAAGEVEVDAPRENEAGDADAAPGPSPEGLFRAFAGAFKFAAKQIFPKTLGRFVPYIGTVIEIAMALWQHWSARQRKKETKEAMQRAARLWDNHIAESADRLNDKAKEIVRQNVDDAFAPAEAGLRAERAQLDKEARAMAGDRTTLNACRERMKRHLEAMLPVPPAA